MGTLSSKSASTPSSLVIRPRKVRNILYSSDSSGNDTTIVEDNAATIVKDKVRKRTI